MFALLLMAGGASGADTVYYIYLADGTVEAFPEKYVREAPTVDDAGTLTLQLTRGRQTWQAGEYVKWNNECPELPEFTSFKFNNKFNPHLHQDVEAVLDGSSTISLTLNAIGKRLTPSFRLSDKAGIVYVDGEEQQSKVTRQRFDRDITYTVTYPGYVILAVDPETSGFIRVPFGRDYTVHTEWLTDHADRVPRIDININGGETVTSKDYYLRAHFRISGNGVYEDMEDSVWIKGRGNSSWSWPKKPYRLKFDRKVKPFGLTKGKSWNLLSNYQTGSMYANAIAMKIGQMAGAAATNHIVPVELYVNGKYSGSYQFTEKLGISNNSVDIDENTSYLLELDTYYDEPYRFRSDHYAMPVNLKDPDLDEMYADDWYALYNHFDSIRADFQAVEEAIWYKDADIEERLDVDACARFLLANDLVCNQELSHPKSTFLYKEDFSSPYSKVVFGPLWDFDWAFGYEQSKSYCRTSTTDKIIYYFGGDQGTGAYFFNDLMAIGIIKKYYYKVWTDFIEADGVAELKEFVQEYYNFAHASFENNATLWNDGRNYESAIPITQSWLETRANHIYDNLTRYDLSDFDHDLQGDVNGDLEVSVTDAALTFSHIMGETMDDFDAARADMNYDGLLNITDVVLIVRKVLAGSRQASPYRFRTPSADSRLAADPFEVGVGESMSVPVALIPSDDVDDDPSAEVAPAYRALQLDVVLPEGLSLVGVLPADGLFGWSLSTSSLDDRTTRIVALPDGDATFTSGTRIFTLTLRADGVVATDRRFVTLSNGRLTTDEGEEQRLYSRSIRFDQTTGIDALSPTTLLVEGGHSLILTAVDVREVDVFATDGRLVQSFTVKPGRNAYLLPAGVYIVAGQKVIIR
jgi:hypothetical protein